MLLILDGRRCLLLAISSLWQHLPHCGKRGGGQCNTNDRAKDFVFGPYAYVLHVKMTSSHPVLVERPSKYTWSELIKKKTQKKTKTHGCENVIIRKYFIDTVKKKEFFIIKLRINVFLFVEYFQVLEKFNKTGRKSFIMHIVGNKTNYFSQSLFLLFFQNAYIHSAMHLSSCWSGSLQ